MRGVGGGSGASKALLGKATVLVLLRDLVYFKLSLHLCTYSSHPHHRLMMCLHKRTET